jgi:hypothetical protein
LYNKFGESGLNKAIDGNEVLLEIAVTYVTWGMLVFVLTLGKGSGSARNWIYSGQIAMLIVEVSLTLQDVTLPDWFLPTTTECEVIWLMHAIFPAFMNGCRVIGSFYYVDVEELTKNTLLSLRDSHKVLKLRLILHIFPPHLAPFVMYGFNLIWVLFFKLSYIYLCVVCVSNRKY